MAVLRSAIVGCGGIAQVHARALSEMPEAELTAFADIIPERAEAMAEKYGGRAYSSLDGLLDHEKIDVLHICTPHYLHTPMARQAAELGINVFTEKPPVIDRQQWAEFKRLGDKVRVGICFQNRYNGSTRALKDLLSTGEAGKVLGSRGFVTWRRDAPYYTESGWRGALSTEGGGALTKPSALLPIPTITFLSTLSFISRQRFQTIFLVSIRSMFPCWMWLSKRAANRLFAEVMAWKSPVKCRFRSSIGTTWA